MSIAGWAQIALFAALLTALTPLIGRWLVWAFAAPPTRWERRLVPLEPQGWKAYATSAVGFSFVCLLASYATLRLQGSLPLNEHGFGAPPWDLSLNTAASFVSNTSWQFYAGETTLSTFSQMTAIALHGLLGAAVGLAVAMAVIRGFASRSTTMLGSFWHDLVRALVRVLLPLCAVGTLVLVACGTVQSLTLGTVASWVPIKTIGSVGGGYFNVNSAMPFENPTALTSFLQALAIVAVPAGLTAAFGRMVGNRRQGWVLYGVMLALFLTGVAVAYAAEAHGTTAQHAAGLHGPNMEGKEQRFGAAGTALYAVATTSGASGAVNGAMESFTGLGALVPTANMATGELIFGGIGSGLYGMLLAVLIGVFVAGLMVGRTPEYLGKKLQPRDVKLVAIGSFGAPLLVLVLTAVATATSYGRASIFAAGPQGFGETLYAYVSQGFNNGSAFAGYTGFVQPNAPGNVGAYGITFANVLGAVAMLIGRYLPMIAALAVAGGLAGRAVAPAGPGTLRTASPSFGIVIAGVVVLVALLTFVPALALGSGVQALTDRLF